MKLALAAALVLLTTPCWAASTAKNYAISVSTGVSDEEFVGPFPSWTNVKTACGAKGNGTTDDTTAIQTCLNGLGSSQPTLWFPSGTYKITSTLTLSAQQYVSVIGQDPDTTTILWAGASGGTMLYLNGVAYSRVNRLTFNGQGNAAIAVDQSKANGTSNYFDTGNEYTDDVFENAGIGFRCGELGFGCAETSMLRDRFVNNTSIGIFVVNANALDMWVWYSVFQNNGTGIGNKIFGGEVGSGNFHVFNSIFQNSSVTDIAYGNTGVFNFRNNYSAGSNQFICCGGTGAPTQMTVQGNTILDTATVLSVSQGDSGPLVFLDNIVRSKSGATVGPVAQVSTSRPNAQAGMFSMGNTFTVTSPTFSNGPYHTFQDQIVARSTVNPAVPTLPGTPPNNNRQIFESAPAGSGTACTAISPCSVQQAVTNAANAEQAGTAHPVVHIMVGSYNLASTVTVPATVNSGIQIIGDGGNSFLTSAGANPVIRLLGPSKAILRDFRINGNNYAADGIEVTNADQHGSKVFLEQAVLSQSVKNLLVDALDYTLVELHGAQHLSTNAAPSGTTSISIVGGTQAAANNWQGGATNSFLGLSADNYYAYGTSNGAHVVIDGSWNDVGGSGGHLIFNASGIGAISYLGSEAALFSGTPTVALTNFQGVAALANISSTGDMDIIGNGSGGKVLGLGLTGPTTTFFSNTASPSPTTELLNSQQTPPPTAIAETAADPIFLAAALDQLRTTQPTLRSPLASDVTDARFYRVFVGISNIGIHLVH